MLKLLEQQQPQVLFRKVRIDERERHTVKREIPCGEPRVLPLVGQREHAHRVEVAPVRVANAQRVRAAAAVLGLSPSSQRATSMR